MKPGTEVPGHPTGSENPAYTYYDMWPGQLDVRVSFLLLCGEG